MKRKRVKAVRRAVEIRRRSALHRLSALPRLWWIHMQIVGFDHPIRAARLALAAKKSRP
jgi:hypothetical protein